MFCPAVRCGHHETPFRWLDHTVRIPLLTAPTCAVAAWGRKASDPHHEDHIKGPQPAHRPDRLQRRLRIEPCRPPRTWTNINIRAAGARRHLSGVSTRRFAVGRADRLVRAHSGE